MASEATLLSMEEKILLLDHRLSMRTALRLYFARFPGAWRIVGEIATPAIATITHQIDEHEPEIMILCRQTAGDLLQSLLRELCTYYPWLALLVTGVQPEAVAMVTAWGCERRTHQHGYSADVTHALARPAL